MFDRLQNLSLSCFIQNRVSSGGVVSQPNCIFFYFCNLCLPHLLWTSTRGHGNFIGNYNTDFPWKFDDIVHADYCIYPLGISVSHAACRTLTLVKQQTRLRGLELHVLAKGPLPKWINKTFEMMFEQFTLWSMRHVSHPLIPAWICNYIPCKVWGEITYPFLNFNGATVEV